MECEDDDIELTPAQRKVLAVAATFETWTTRQLRKWARQRIEQLGFLGEAKEIALGFASKVTPENVMVLLTPSDRPLWNRGLLILRELERSGLIEMAHQTSPTEEVILTFALPKPQAQRPAYLKAA